MGLLSWPILFLLSSGAVNAEIETGGDDVGGCVILEKLALAEEQLESLPLKVWDNQSSDPVREVGLAILASGCDVRIVKVIKHGDNLVVPVEYGSFQIEIIQRLKRTWNSTSTQLRVIEPTGATVVLVKYPLAIRITSIQRGKTSKGKSWKKTITRTEIKNVIGAPYNPDLRIPEVLIRAKEYLNKVVTRAFVELEGGGLKYPEIKPSFIKALPLLEQSDPDECQTDCFTTFEMILVRIGVDLERAFSQTSSRANARGMMQYTPSTYRMISNWAPRAKLEPNFSLAVKDHANITKAAILLHAYNLKELKKAFGPGIADDPYLEEYLVAAYNGGIGRVIKTVKASRLQNKEDWMDGVIRVKDRKKHWRTLTILYETRNYVFKLRALRALNII